MTLVLHGYVCMCSTSNTPETELHDQPNPTSPPQPIWVLGWVTVFGWGVGPSSTSIRARRHGYNNAYYSSAPFSKQHSTR